jgi:hypothetical protein
MATEGSRFTIFAGARAGFIICANVGMRMPRSRQRRTVLSRISSFLGPISFKGHSPGKG